MMWRNWKPNSYTPSNINKTKILLEPYLGKEKEFKLRENKIEKDKNQQQEEEEEEEDDNNPLFIPNNHAKQSTSHQHTNIKKRKTKQSHKNQNPLTKKTKRK